MEPGSFGAVVATQVESGAAITPRTAEEEKTMNVQQTDQPWDFVCNPDNESMCANLLRDDSPLVPEEEEQAPPEGLEHFVLVHPDQVVIKVPVGVTIDFDQFGLQPVEPRDFFLSEEVADDDLEEAQRVLEFLGEEVDGHTVVIQKLKNPDDDLFQTINRVQEKTGFPASPHYLMKPAPKWRYGPHGNVARLDPADKWSDLKVTGPDSAAPSGRVIVIDTGGNGNLSAIGISVAEPEPNPNPPNGLLPEAVGHGTFAASIAKKYNPGLNVELYRASGPGGVLDEAWIVAAFRRAQPASGDVLSLSFGTYPAGPKYDPLIFPRALDIAFKAGARVVAASGNDGPGHVPTQLYPASQWNVIGVSALDKTWSPPVWANAGDVYAPGVDVVSWYHDKTAGSLAVWSGTSFATPYHAACLASGGVC